LGWEDPVDGSRLRMRNPISELMHYTELLLQDLNYSEFLIVVDDFTIARHVDVTFVTPTRLLSDFHNNSSFFQSNDDIEPTWDKRAKIMEKFLQVSRVQHAEKMRILIEGMQIFQ
jgi:hypothetical protein